MVRGQSISFEDLTALRTTFLMKVATSFNLYFEAARYDAATTFEIDISELKTSQNKMQPFNDTLKTRSIAKYFHLFQSSLLTSRNESVDWDSFLPQVGGYNGHEELSRT